MFSILFYTAEDRLGDALIKLPAILGLKRCRPDVQLIWTTGERRSAYADLLSPLVAQAIHEIHENSKLGRLFVSGDHPLRKRRFDCVIAGETKLTSTLALRGIPHRCFIAPAARFLFSDKKPTRPVQRGLADQTRLLFELAIEAPVRLETTLPIPDSFCQLARERLPAGPAYIGFAPGAGGIEKCWPLASFIATALAQASRHRTPVFFLGPLEAHWRSQISQCIPGALFPEFDALGTSTGRPLLTIALARRLVAAVANDAGAGHLLAAGGCRLISLFGKTDAEKFAPPFGNPLVIRASEFASTRVAAIPVDRVTAAIDEVCRIADG